ncbi:MAG: aminotransferase class V-fold PLP-dependent enzyme [Burkholderiaceae bacterium]|jgi:glutamate/tyrosine decarboxylase-like PLP-dependent enzyme
MSQNEVLERARVHALHYLDSLSDTPVGATLTAGQLRDRFSRPLPETGLSAAAVIDQLVQDVEGGLHACTGGRFFGWVIGGVLPSALAADWLTSAWDQNAASAASAPAEAVVEELCGSWLKELLGLPQAASFAFVTGCQMAHTTALAAARHKLLALRGFDVERDGMAGSPGLRVLTSEHGHESILRASRLVGIGSNAVKALPCNDDGAIRMDALSAALADPENRPTVVCLQAGDLNTGAFDAFTPACEVAHAAGAWVHVDGAFGLWAATSERHRHYLFGVDLADSWATDGHKWLNLPFDNGFVFVADPPSHQAVFAQATSYAMPLAGVREPKDWNPEWSRRARGFVVYAAICELGRSGIGELVGRCCEFATQIVEGLARLPGVEVLAPPRINQGLVRFLGDDGKHDDRTDAVISAIQASGEAWFGGVTWRGRRAMRISVCNWKTTAGDVSRTLAAFERILT